MQLVFAIMSKLDKNDAAINMLQFRFNRNKSKFKYSDNKSLRFWYYQFRSVAREEFNKEDMGKTS